MLAAKIDLLNKKVGVPGANHHTRMVREECGHVGHMGITCLTTHEDVNFVGSPSDKFHPNQGFNMGDNRPNILFDNRQQCGAEQNVNKDDPSLRDIMQEQLKISREFSKVLTKFGSNWTVSHQPYRVSWKPTSC